MVEFIHRFLFASSHIERIPILGQAIIHPNAGPKLYLHTKPVHEAQWATAQEDSVFFFSFFVNQK